MGFDRQQFKKNHLLAILVFKTTKRLISKEAKTVLFQRGRGKLIEMQLLEMPLF